jgi:hypothetical protein
MTSKFLNLHKQDPLVVCTKGICNRVILMQWLLELLRILERTVLIVFTVMYHNGRKMREIKFALHMLCVLQAVIVAGFAITAVTVCSRSTSPPYLLVGIVRSHCYVV